MANEEHLAILKKALDANDISIWNQWRKNNPEIEPSLICANLEGANLSNANFRDTDFDCVNLMGANLSKAILSGASFDRADISYANLQGANLNAAVLISTNLYKSLMADAELYQTICGWTLFADIDLSTVKGLETIDHYRPSTLGLDTLLKSGKLPKKFLRGCGVPKTIIEKMNDIIDVPQDELHSCFISYSTADTEFAELLIQKLRDFGVQIYFAPDEILPGQFIADELSWGIRYSDKVLFCCSKSSLTEKWWVEFEKTEALTKEQDLQRERGQKVGVLIPLDLDGYVFSEEFKSNPHRGTLHSRNIADFVDWKNDKDKFNQEVEKVMRALRTDGGRSRPPKSKL